MVLYQDVQIQLAATTYDASATVDDGSCLYSSVLTITTTVCSSATSVALTGPWWGWDPTAGPTAVDNGNGTWTFTLDPAPTADMEYLLVVDGVQEDLVAAGTASGDWSCTPITDYFSYANRQWVVGSGICYKCLWIHVVHVLLVFQVVQILQQQIMILQQL